MESLNIGHNCANRNVSSKIQVNVAKFVACVQYKITQCYTLLSCASEVALPELYTAVIFVSFPKVFSTIGIEKPSSFCRFDHKSDLASVFLRCLHILACSVLPSLNPRGFIITHFGFSVQDIVTFFCVEIQSVFTGQEKRESSLVLLVDAFSTKFRACQDVFVTRPHLELIPCACDSQPSV